MSFQILDPSNPLWGTLFESLPADQQDIFYSPSYARLCRATLNRDDEVLCAAMTSVGAVVLYPFVKRSLSKLTNSAQCTGFYDVTSLYGRGGIVGSPAARANLSAFHAAMDRYCRDNAVICGFDRFHPVIGNDACAAPSTRVTDVGGFVVVDMRPGMESIEGRFKASVRKDLRKAERNGIDCVVESNCARLETFLDIYYQTMERNSARHFYYFQKEYFLGLEREIPGKFHFFYARSRGDIVSCELVLHHGKYCHSFLGGTKQAALPLCANPLLKREVIKFFKAQGCEYFLLGGGTSPGDGIFNFKKAYAPEGVFPSWVGGKVWDYHTYERLKHELPVAGIEVAKNRFQFYDVT